MEEVTSLLIQHEWRIIDHSGIGLLSNPIDSFATDDTLCESVGSGLSPAVARTWVHRPYISLGIQDVRLPHLRDGLQFLREQGYGWIVRTSGGLAVVLDEGILNITLIFPEREKGIDINRGYEAMYRFVQDMFQDVTDEIEAKEIHGSYCPGSYDLSINGKKFAGISQRRLKHGVAVQMYMAVSGSGGKRAELVRQFYERSVKGEPTKFDYPKIQPEVMASLTELLQTEFTIEQCMGRFLRTLQTFSKRTLYNSELTPVERDRYEHYLTRILDRNDKWLPKMNG
ncbi:lipoate--protein ligase family protein [Fervidibacillus albus]|uniref:Octanoyl-[GcvH]:protein N-octanoyltransferase n=1 Tax=Fervidibacillus albus TaxID=2980026 RepID=A0A9E8LVM5_9BACI|nr:biotin/lipoate A/B protein ligase family protein [Fervidibacillus albus]WAA09624.1 lipoate--protein ligase family protein [Fervidibacillus albus]